MIKPVSTVTVNNQFLLLLGVNFPKLINWKYQINRKGVVLDLNSVHYVNEIMLHNVNNLL